MGHRKTCGYLLVIPLLFASNVCAEKQKPLLAIEKKGMDVTLQHALEKNRINQSSHWANPDTTSSIEIIPVRAFSDDKGRVCREFTTYIQRKSRSEQGYGTACRKTRGQWQIISNLIYDNDEDVERQPVHFVASRGFFYSARNPYYMPRSVRVNYSGYSASPYYQDDNYRSRRTYRRGGERWGVANDYSRCSSRTRSRSCSTR